MRFPDGRTEEVVSVFNLFAVGILVLAGTGTEGTSFGGSCAPFQELGFLSKAISYSSTSTPRSWPAGTPKPVIQLLTERPEVFTTIAWAILSFKALRYVRSHCRIYYSLIITAQCQRTSSAFHSKSLRFYNSSSCIQATFPHKALLFAKRSPYYSTTLLPSNLRSSYFCFSL